MYIDAIPFLDSLGKAERELFDSSIHPAHFEKGHIIHLGTGDCVGLLYVESGSIRVYMTSNEGREVTLFRIEKGDVCVLSASCVLEAVDFEVTIEAETDTEVMELPASVFARLVRENKDVELFSYKVTTERFSDVMWAMQQILFLSFDKRLAGFLIQECQKNNTDTICMTHDQIAKNLGSAREVVSRMLKNFEKEGMVSLSKGRITLTDCKALNRI